MHTEYGVPEVKEQQPRSFAKGLHQPETSCSCNSRLQERRRVTSASFLPFRSSRLGHSSHWLSVPGCSVVCSPNENSFPSLSVAQLCRANRAARRRRSTLPVSFLGNAETIRITLGTLKSAKRVRQNACS